MRGNIKFIKNEFLYVDIDGNTVKIKNPYDYEPKNVEVIKVNGEYYIKGFVPKKNKE